MHLKVSKKYLAAKCSIMHRQYEYIFNNEKIIVHITLFKSLNCQGRKVITTSYD